MNPCETKTGVEHCDHWWCKWIHRIIKDKHVCEQQQFMTKPVGVWRRRVGEGRIKRGRQSHQHASSTPPLALSHESDTPSSPPPRALRHARTHATLTQLPSWGRSPNMPTTLYCLVSPSTNLHLLTLLKSVNIDVKSTQVKIQPYSTRLFFLRGSTSAGTEANDSCDESCPQPFVAVNVGRKSQLLSVFKQKNISILLFLCFLSV